MHSISRSHATTRAMTSASSRVALHPRPRTTLPAGSLHRSRRQAYKSKPVFVFQLLVVHPAHAADATAAWHGRSTLLRRLGHHGFGGDHEAGDRCRVL